MKKKTALALAYLLFLLILPPLSPVHSADVKVKGSNVYLNNSILSVNDALTAWVDVRRFGLLQQAIDNAVGKTLYVASTINITDNTTIPATVGVRVEQGGSFNVDNNVTLYILGSFEAGRYRVFSGGGTVSWGRNLATYYPNAAKSMREVYPEWWGAIAGVDPSTDNAAVTLNTVAFQAAVNSVGRDTNGNFGGRVQIAALSYDINGTLHMRRGVELQGMGSRSQIFYTGSGKAIDIVPSPPVDTGTSIFDVSINDLVVRPRVNTATHGIYSYNLINGRFRNLTVWGIVYSTFPPSHGFTTAGVEFSSGESTYNIKLENPFITYCGGNGLAFNGDGTGPVNGSMINIEGGDISWNDNNGLSTTQGDWSINSTGVYYSANKKSNVSIGVYGGGVLSGNIFEAVMDNTSPNFSTQSQVKIGWERDSKGLVFVGNGFFGGDNTAGAQLNLSGSDGVLGGLISGNIFGARALYAINLGTSQNMNVTGNILGDRQLWKDNGVPPVELFDPSSPPVNNVIGQNLVNYWNHAQSAYTYLLGQSTRLGIGTPTPRNSLEVMGPGIGLVVTDNSALAADVGGLIEMWGRTDTNQYQKLGLIKAGKFDGSAGHEDSYLDFFYGNRDTGVFTAGTRLTPFGDWKINKAGKGIVLKNAAGTVTKRVRLNDVGDGLIFEAE